MSYPRIVHIIDTLSWGGAQKLLITFAEAARERGFLPTVVSLRPRNDSPFQGELEALGVRVVTFPCRRIIEPVQFWRLMRFLRHERFDIIHTHLTQANVMGVLAGALAGIPVVSSLHNTKIRVRRFHQARQAVETFLLRNGARRVIAVGHTVADAQRSRMRAATMCTIPNAVSPVPPLAPEERIAVRRDIMGDPSRTLLISVGRVTAQKGVGDLITAFAAISAKHPEATLALVGRGDLLDQTREQVQRLGLADRVLLLGARSDVPRLLAAADLFVSASHWEGLPVAVLEAMSAGLPILATGVGDVGRVVAEGTGVVVPAQQPQRFASALDELLNDRQRLLRIGVAAKEHVMRVYGPHVWLDQLLALYNDVLARGVRPPVVVS